MLTVLISRCRRRYRLAHSEPRVISLFLRRVIRHHVLMTSQAIIYSNRGSFLAMPCLAGLAEYFLLRQLCLPGP